MAKSIFSYHQILSKFKAEDYSQLYLFYGEEEYLIQYLIGKIEQRFLNEHSRQLDAKTIDCESSLTKLNVNELLAELQTPSFMSEKKVVIIKNSGILAKKSNEAEAILDKIYPELNSGAILIFVEEKINKRLKTLSNFQEYGEVVNLEKQDVNTLINWAGQYFGKHSINISKEAAENLVERCERNMLLLRNEFDKFRLICQSSNINKIDMEMIEEYSVPDVRAGIFELTDSIAAKRIDKALDLYDKMLEQKISPIYIMFMVARQFKQLYVAKKSKNKNELKQKLNCGDFVANKLLQQIRNFSLEAIHQAYLSTADMDYKVKSGQVNERQSVELLILEIANF